MNKKNQPAMYKDPFARLVLALLKPRDGCGGWVRVEDLAQEAGCSKSTVRRQLDALEAHGFPIEHHIDRGVARKHALGVRSLLVARSRDIDPDPTRWSTRIGQGSHPRSGRNGAAHPWRQHWGSNARNQLREPGTGERQLD